MTDTTADSICVYGARIVSKQAKAMAEEVDGVRESTDIEYIHRMRVATRRLRSALRIFDDCFGRKAHKKIVKDIRDVTRALGEARDLDVQLELLSEEAPKYKTVRLAPGIKRLQLRLGQRRTKAQEHVVAAMDELEQDQVIEELLAWAEPLIGNVGEVYLYSPALYQLAFDGVQTQIAELLSHEEYIHDPANVTQLHEMRISAKRLRYTLEAFEDLYGKALKTYINQVKKLQDLLGTIHDADVWMEMIPDLIAEERELILLFFDNERPLRRLLPGLEAFRNDRQALREKTYEEFLVDWKKIKSSGMLTKLKNVVNAPVNMNQIMKSLQALEASQTAEPPVEEASVRESKPDQAEEDAA